MLYLIGVTHPFAAGWLVGYLVGGAVAVAHAVAALRVARHFIGAGAEEEGPEPKKTEKSAKA